MLADERAARQFAGGSGRRLKLGPAASTTRHQVFRKELGMAPTKLATMWPGEASPPGEASGVFARLMSVASMVAGVAHMGFIFMFQQVGVPVLALANVASVLIYVLAVILIQRGRLSTATLLVASEVLVHGVAATVVIGWDAGFHHYIVLVLPFAVAMTYYPVCVRITLAGLVALGYLAMDFAYRQAGRRWRCPRLCWLRCTTSTWPRC